MNCVDPVGNPDVRRRAVLLSGSLGKGHDTLAEGCETRRPRGLRSESP